MSDQNTPSLLNGPRPATGKEMQPWVELLPSTDRARSPLRYVLKLFRDYVFHQTLGSSRVPVLDAG